MEMESSSVSARSKRQRLILVSSPASLPMSDVPATFDSLNDDTLGLVLEFVGDKSFRSFGGLNKRCKEVYLNTQGMTKATFLFGYAPLVAIKNYMDGYQKHELQIALCKGIVLYSRSDVLDWVLKKRKSKRKKKLLRAICIIAAQEGSIDILVKVWNNVEDDDSKEWIFRNSVETNAVRNGKLNVLKWLETKRFLSMDESECAYLAARCSQLNILKWLYEVKGLKLFDDLYKYAAWGGQLHVMKWLREQKVDWDVVTFWSAAEEGNLDVLQWLHDEGCPWPEDHRVYFFDLTPEVIVWCRSNGYGDRIYSK